MGTQYVSGGVRQKIFRELVVRLQKQVIDVMSPWYGLLRLELSL